MPPLRKATFVFDDSPLFHGYQYGEETKLGYAKPLFPLESMIAISRFLMDQLPGAETPRQTQQTDPFLLLPLPLRDGGWMMLAKGTGWLIGYDIYKVPGKDGHEILWDMQELGLAFYLGEETTMGAKLTNPKKTTAIKVIKQTVEEMYALNASYQDLCDELDRPKLRRKRMKKLVEKIGKITGAYI